MRRHLVDENCQHSQVALVRAKVRSVAQVGVDWGQQGWTDREQTIRLVYYDVPAGELAHWVRRFLRARQFNTHAKRFFSMLS